MKSSTNKNLEKLISELPCNIEAEQILLGAMLRDNRVCDAVGDLITSEVFFDPLHRRIFEQIFKINKRGLVANELSLKMFFDHDEALIESGGVEYLAKIATKASIIFDIKNIANIVVDAYLRRCLISFGQDMITNAYNYDIDNPAVYQIENAAQKLFLLSNQGKSDSTYSKLAFLVENITKRIEFARSNEGTLQGISVGFRDLDQLLNGLQKSDLIILAARPSMGKTALALNMALNACKLLHSKDQYTGMHIGFFSLEMSAEQLASRVIAIESEVSSYKALSGKISGEELNKVIDASTKVCNLPLIIDDTSSLSISSLRTRIRRMHQLYNLGAVFIDYLQLVKGTTKRSGENRVQEVSEVTQGLKAIAKELNIPVVALSQLSRLVEQRDDKKPQLSDLRDSGSIEQDADIVMFLYREEYYELRKQPAEGTNKHIAWQEKMNSISNVADVLISKQRNGPIGNVKLFFEAEKGRFKDYTAKYNPADFNM
ncbi:replicative DNA helicase [Ehrlichia ruminantium]|uniref:Replicative DNA helicase n=1 Tax=Ehrlichia ruminantium TaxID=779 RepID=A0AAE6Q9U6_EHRRU|nr:replicative DNA helicase [Ehrlichia ruminantium]QGR02989.1 replicative DNA helicase [Ehrlichia ruminantium]QGR03916.1 replicative DNA helicase [Ehrlichia ruminantium]QGR04838.1 replicative DNA helicase [Ehrlichia ruminantium]